MYIGEYLIIDDANSLKTDNRCFAAYVIALQ